MSELLIKQLINFTAYNYILKLVCWNVFKTGTSDRTYFHHSSQFLNIWSETVKTKNQPVKQF